MMTDIFLTYETSDWVPWKGEGEYICIHQQGSGKWVGVHVDARVKSDSWTCGIRITFLSHFIHTNTHLNCILI